MTDQDGIGSNGDESSLLVAKNVTKHFPMDEGLIEWLFGNRTYVHAVNEISLRINRNEILGLVGESGCGKSTLGRTLAGLYTPTSGSIFYEGREVSNFSRREWKALRKEIQFIFQDPHAALNPRRTVGELIGQPLKVHNLARGEAKRERVNQLLTEVGLDPEYRDRYPHEFSGGQQQRIGIARALAVEPKIIIADEPVSALDVSVQAQIINLLKRLQESYNLSYVFIAHDLSVVKHVSDRVAVMYLGHLMEEARTEVLFNNPQHPYTRALLRAIPDLDDSSKARKNLLKGSPPSPINPPNGCPFHTRCPEYIGEVCETDYPQYHTCENDTHRVACHWMERSEEERADQSTVSY